MVNYVNMSDFEFQLNDWFINFLPNEEFKVFKNTTKRRQSVLSFLETEEDTEYLIHPVELTDEIITHNFPSGQYISEKEDIAFDFTDIGNGKYVVELYDNRKDVPYNQQMKLRKVVRYVHEAQQALRIFMDRQANDFEVLPKHIYKQISRLNNEYNRTEQG